MIFNEALHATDLRLVFDDKSTTGNDGNIGSQFPLRMFLTGLPKQNCVNSQNDCENRYNRRADAINYITRRKFASAGIGILLLLVVPVVGLLLAYGRFYWTGIGLICSWGLIVIGSLMFILCHAIWK